MASSSTAQAHRPGVLRARRPLRSILRRATMARGSPPAPVAANRATIAIRRSRPGPQQHRGRPMLLHIEDLSGHGNRAAQRHRTGGMQRDAEGAETFQENAPATWKPPTATTSNAMRWKGERSSQCALTNSRTPAASMIPPNASATITGQRARRCGAWSLSNCRIRSACCRSRICASTQRSSDGSSSILMCLPSMQGSRQKAMHGETGSYEGGRAWTCFRVVHGV